MEETARAADPWKSRRGGLGVTPGKLHAGHPVDSLETWLDEAERKAAALPASREELARTLCELRTALEEVAVADEELRVQNDELLATREALEAERQRYLELFESAPDGYLVTDPSGTIVKANRAAAALLNTSVKGLAGKPFAVFIGRRRRGDFRALLLRLHAGDRIPDWELEIVPRGGQPLTALLTAAREPVGLGRPDELRLMLRDVSQARATERALRDSEERLRHAQRLEAIGRLAGGIAHSFNNLLAAIGFHAELLGERLGDAGACGHLEEIQKATDRAADLARQLLAFGRKQMLNPQVLDVNALVAGVQELLRRIIGEDVTLAVRLADDPAAVDADPAQLEQVLLNLVVNARDAMPEGGRLTISTEIAALADGQAGTPELPAGEYVLITVADTGSGMAPEVRERAFEPFFTTKERGQGTGLGLATVYGIVRQSGGDVTVESEPGQGSTFRVWLPRAPAAPAPRQERRRRSRPVSRGSEVVLLVEDEDNIREPAAALLEAQGYTVLAAPDAAQGLEAAQGHQGPIHLLVTDVIMPGLSGSQLADRLVSERPDLRVLYISGYPEDALVRHGVTSSRERFLQKPFPPPVFLTTVREILDGG